MPQFDFANVFIPQLFWLAVFFVILYFGIVKPTLPRLGKVMDQREDKITGDLAAAKAAKDNADTVEEAVAADLDRSREQARAAIVAAKADAAGKNEKRLASAEKRLDKKLADAEERIAAARVDAAASIREIATESAQAIVAKLTGDTPEREAAMAQVEAALGPQSHAAS